MRHDYGNPAVNVISNMRPVMSMPMVSGRQKYPGQEKLKKWMNKLAARLDLPILFITGGPSP